MEGDQAVNTIIPSEKPKRKAKTVPSQGSYVPVDSITHTAPPAPKAESQAYLSSSHRAKVASDDATETNTYEYLKRAYGDKYFVLHRGLQGTPYYEQYSTIDFWLFPKVSEEISEDVNADDLVTKEIVDGVIARKYSPETPPIFVEVKKRGTEGTNNHIWNQLWAKREDGRGILANIELHKWLHNSKNKKYIGTDWGNTIDSAPQEPSLFLPTGKFKGTGGDGKGFNYFKSNYPGCKQYMIYSYVVEPTNAPVTVCIDCNMPFPDKWIATPKAYDKTAQTTKSFEPTYYVPWDYATQISDVGDSTSNQPLDKYFSNHLPIKSLRNNSLFFPTPKDLSLSEHYFNKQLDYKKVHNPPTFIMRNMGSSFNINDIEMGKIPTIKGAKEEKEMRIREYEESLRKK